MHNLRTAASAAIALIIAAPIAPAAETIHTVALQNNQIPGQPPGTRFFRFGAPAINDSGDVTFGGTITGGTSGSGVWTGSTPANLATLLRSGLPAPGLAAGYTFDTFEHLRPEQHNLQILNNGQVLLVARVKSGTATAGVPYLLSPSATAKPIIVPGQPRPGNDDAWGPGVHDLFSTPAGRFTFVEAVTGATPHERVYTGTSGASLNRITLSTPAPPSTIDVTGTGISPGGQVSIWTRSRDPFNDGSITSYHSSGNAFVPAFQPGQPAPGLAPSTVHISHSLAFNPSGRAVIGGTVRSPQKTAVWTRAPGAQSFSLYVTGGQPAPQLPGLTFDTVHTGPLAISPSDRIFFPATLAGPGVNSSNDLAFFAGHATDPNSVKLIAREGDPVRLPGGGTRPFTPTGLTLNAAEQIVFYNATSLFGYDSSLGLVLLAAAGDTVQVAPGVNKTIRDFRSTNTDFSVMADGHYNSGRPRGLNNLGQVAFHATFTDNTDGIFTTRIPVAGDATADGIVNLADFNVLFANFDKSGPGIDRDEGDFNLDGKVTFADFQMLERSFGYAAPGLSANVTPADYTQLARFAATVPEPTAPLLLTVSCGFAIRRQRRFPSNRTPGSVV